MVTSFPPFIKQCLNVCATEVIIVIGEHIPDFLQSSARRVVLSELKDLVASVRYHQEGYRQGYERWLSSICITCQLSSLVIEKISHYFKCDLLDGNGNIIISKSASRTLHLLKGYNVTLDINLFSLAKAQYLGSDIKQDQVDIDDKIRLFHEEVNSISHLSKRKFSSLMKKSNKAYLDSVIDASLDFEPSKHGIRTYYDKRFSGFYLGSFITHPLKFEYHLYDGKSNTRKPFPMPDITLLKAGTGTGKTELAIQILHSFHRQKKRTVLISNLKSVIGSFKHRVEDSVANHLLEQDTTGPDERIKQLSLVTSDAPLIALETSNHVVSTLKSITKQVIQHRIKYADLVIIDEAEKVLEAVYATGEKYLTKAEKDTIKNLLSVIFSGQQKVILMDADLTDHLTTTVVKKDCGDRRVVAGILPPTAVCDNVSKTNIQAKIGEWGRYQEHLLSNGLKPNTKNFIVCDSKKSIESWLISSGYFIFNGQRKVADFKAAIENKILAIVKGDDDKNYLLEEQDAFLNDPSNEIQKYDTVIVSPILKEGFDINTKHAEIVTVFASGVLTPKELIQFASRLRTAKRMIFGLLQPPPFHSISFYRHAYTEDERFEARLAKHRQILLDNLHYALYETLRRSGFKIDDSDEVLPKGDVEYTYNLSLKHDFDATVKSMLRGEADISMHSQDARKQAEAVEVLRRILHLASFSFEPTKIPIKSTGKLEVSIESIFYELLDNSSVVNYILPKSLKITTAWKKFEMRGMAAKVNKLFRLLGFDVQRTNKGKMVNVIKREEGSGT
ncbi:DEAD/DEAH box helicase family protein [Vibrio vulnificus]|nr:DEAD/DEAH box helicase family protein [Vibrio vulnificus]EIA1307521.1 DEAD/DEAH box helicase family protein [Vibrio vulnificus]EIX4884292.1 DEAD/DEAH box helicase family protein [Vibrio vulnificus]ELP6805606.1 DEAD/DEAH box helicase family protein [Vibrio vulnificus]